MGKGSDVNYYSDRTSDRIVGATSALYACTQTLLIIDMVFLLYLMQNTSSGWSWRTSTVNLARGRFTFFIHCTKICTYLLQFSAKYDCFLVQCGSLKGAIKLIPNTHNKHFLPTQSVGDIRWESKLMGSTKARFFNFSVSNLSNIGVTFNIYRVFDNAERIGK